LFRARVTRAPGETWFFRDAYAAYLAETKVAPSVVIVHVGQGGGPFADDLARRGIEVLRYAFRGDYYALPNVLPLLSLPTRAELVDQIMQRDLPKRAIADCRF
jgi:hypothetical protein